MKNAVFFDIDGTLWDEKMYIPESTASAIRKLRENGNYAFLCSGRTRANIYAKELMEDIGFDGVIAGCGTYIEYHGDVVFEELISEEAAERLLSFLQECKIPVVLEGHSCLYADMEDFLDDLYILNLKQQLGDLFLPLADYKYINKFTANLKNGIKEQMIERLSGEYELLFHEGQYVEGIPKGFSKASGIRWICDYLNIAHKNTYAFGDSVNDLDMLAYVQNGVAMGNAADCAKEAADYVTAGLHEDGIFLGLKHFSLI